MIRILPVALLATCVVLQAALGTVMSVQRVHLRHQLEVQAVCDRSRAMLDGSAEELCGYVQDKYDIEYLCDSISTGATCWTEVK